jgi:uncharacterized membrane-anchored protein YjiN (DUF445 family)
VEITSFPADFEFPPRELGMRQKASAAEPRLVFDGGHGDGGGQILRTALAPSALTGRSISSIFGRTAPSPALPPSTASVLRLITPGTTRPLWLNGGTPRINCARRELTCQSPSAMPTENLILTIPNEISRRDKKQEHPAMRQAPYIADVESKRLALRRNRLVAGSLLVIAVLVFIGIRLFVQPSFAAELISAAAEAAIVGGLADWFAVTALFRRPLGLPIPHTALIPARKDEIGKSLGGFVRDQFLDPELLIERLRKENRAVQLAQWVDTAGAANFIAERVIAIVPIILNYANDAQIRTFLGNVAHGGLRRLDLVPTLDAIIEALIRASKHMEIVDAVIEILRPSLEGIKELIIERIGEQTGRFFPRYFDRRIGKGLVDGIEKWLDAVRTSGSDERLRLDVWTQETMAKFRASPDYPRLIEQAQRVIVNHPALAHSLGAIWDEIRRELMDDVFSPSPKIGSISVEVVRTIGRLLQETPAVQQYLNTAIERILVDYITPWRVEIGNYIAEVVESWDGPKIADAIELQVGRDLQYIRINGTLVGALIGSALFLIGVAMPGLLKAAAAIRF